MMGPVVPGDPPGGRPVGLPENRRSVALGGARGSGAKAELLFSRSIFAAHRKMARHADRARGTGFGPLIAFLGRDVRHRCYSKPLANWGLGVICK